MAGVMFLTCLAVGMRSRQEGQGPVIGHREVGNVDAHIPALLYVRDLIQMHEFHPLGLVCSAACVDQVREVVRGWRHYPKVFRYVVCCYCCRRCCSCCCRCCPSCSPAATAEEEELLFYPGHHPKEQMGFVLVHVEADHVIPMD